MFGIGPVEFLLIGVVALLVFGPKRLPELARTLGRGMGEFRRASSDLRQSLALDDLQRDLREGLDPTRQTIHRPEDRPAQAGDELDPGADGSTAAKASAAPHPGELPLGNDHEHNDQPLSEEERADLDEVAAGTPGDRAELDSPPAEETAESELGSVPVGGQSAGPPTVDPKRG